MPSNQAPDTTHLEALFLGPQGENADFYGALLTKALTDHAAWRARFSGGAPDAFITPTDRGDPRFEATRSRIEATLTVLQERLRDSQPFFSPRYLGHMTGDTLLAAAVAYFQASLYNPNNVAKGGGSATSPLELEVSDDLCTLLGFVPKRAWGHLTAGGTTANMESLWIARNLKYLPCAVREALERLAWPVDPLVRLCRDATCELSRLTTPTLVSEVSPGEAVELLDRTRLALPEKVLQRFDDALEETNLQWRGVDGLDLGVLVVPQTKHYSWKKVADLLGLGRRSLRFVPVDEKYRMDLSQLRATLLREDRPVLAVVGVVGSTEEGSVDPVDGILAVRDECAALGRAFYVHIDAAYGGYAASIFRDGAGRFLSRDELRGHLGALNIVSADAHGLAACWPDEAVVRAYEALARVDAITLDPHKLGYIQYPAGGVCYRDKRFREAIQCFAPYVFDKPEPGQPDELIGAYILEGSKPGATAAAVWTAHRTLPLDVSGYGRLIGETIDGACALYDALETGTKPGTPRTFAGPDGRRFLVRPVVAPDLNIVTYAFNEQGNTDLAVMNALNTHLTNTAFGPMPQSGGTILDRTFIVSSTGFSFEEYGAAPRRLLEELGIAADQWGPGKSVKILRSTVLSPYLTTDYVRENYVRRFLEALAEEFARLPASL